MNAILRSAKPYWIYLIITGMKKAEVGKDCPKSKDWNRTVEMYCSKDKRSFNRIPEKDREWMRKYLGKVACRFVCDSLSEYNTNYLDGEDRLKATTCLDDQGLMAYVEYLNRTFYLWHISDLKIYDTPKELGEFRTACHKLDSDQCGDCPHLRVELCPYPCGDDIDVWCGVDNRKPLTRPPQSWCYVDNLQ